MGAGPVEQGFAAIVNAVGIDGLIVGMSAVAALLITPLCYRWAVRRVHEFIERT